MGVAKRRALALATSFTLIAALMVIMAPPALAHHATVSAVASCVDGDPVVRIEVWSWTEDEQTVGRYHSAIEVRIGATSGTGGELIHTGKFLPASEDDWPSAEGYDLLEEVSHFRGTGGEFAVVFDATEHAGETVRFSAGPRLDPPTSWWNEVPAGPGDWRETGDIVIPEDCSASLTVHKLVPEGSPASSFVFEWIEGEGSWTAFGLAGNASSEPIVFGLSDGETVDVAIREVIAGLAAGWTFGSVECPGVEAAEAEANLELSIGDHVDCYFSNRYDAPPPPPPPPAPVLGSIGDLFWFDTDQDGVQDSTEPGVAGATITLFDRFGTVIATTVSGPNGEYLFSNVPAGVYEVRFEIPALEPGLTGSFTLVRVGDAALDSDADVVSGSSGWFELAAGAANLTVDAGIVTAQVAGTTVVNTTTTAAPVSPITLPFTGPSESGSALVLGIALAGLGGLVLAAVKREEEEEAAAGL